MSATRRVHTYPFEGEVHGLELHPKFEELRESDPLARVRPPYGGEGWLVTRYDDVRTANSDPRFSRNQIGEDTPRTTPLARRGDTILSMDPPEHTRLRKLVSKAFTARRMGAMQGWLEELFAGLLDTAEHKGAPADVVRDLAEPFTIAVICRLLGVPYEDREKFQHWSEVIMSTTAYTKEEAVAADASIRAYLADLVAARRGGEYDDLLQVLVSARDEGDRLSEDELITFGVTLLVAGHETSAHQLANMIYVLLTHEDQLALLRERPELLQRAVEELLRFVPLGNGVGNARTALEDVELSGGTVRAGEGVMAAAVNANRDPRMFEDPDRLDITREKNPHLAFGHGAHYCLGAQLARMELRVAIGGMLERFPELRLAVPADEVEWKSGGLFRGPRRLPVAW
ncbi:cytochrome P450 [Streptomyces xanthii]|uniref:Cytochrome P450 n=1 Tax=Streptomyces xanthii TaxID=2768069 RepID=A0A7H1BKN3_9ACTN|nr:cytochrome P450 [Streptomyces xanthii]QNS09288.1 cytochrome P450 [Streptomyces xanthii]